MNAESLEHCATALSYIEEMTAWFDEDVESETRLDFARKVLAEIEQKGKLGRDELAYCEERLNVMFGHGHGEG